MQRTHWRGFGDGDADPAATTIGDLIAANDARIAGLVNVDPFTALQSKFAGVVPAGARLPLIVAGLGLAALLLIPENGGRRR
jgi:hypothetical protein